MATALEIAEKAKELGFDRCGIIPVRKMAAYEERLKERIEQFPETGKQYQKLLRFAYPQEKYPWAKSVVVCSFWYGKYRIPDEMRGRIARYYLTDGRRQTYSDGYKTSAAFERYLRESGLKIAFDRDFGITGLRWAAQEAGIGLIRKNNFFYTEKGSFQYLEAFLIDQPLEYTETCSLKPCPDQCTLCLKACPTQSLAAPYAMNRTTCISDLTTWGDWDVRKNPARAQFGEWVYGCDACQECCPYNRVVRMETEEYPGLQKLSEKFSMTQIVASDYEQLEQSLQPLLWYIPAEKSWRYKVNALNAMLNHYKPEYRQVIQAACKDEKEPVREMAKWVLEQLK